MFVKYDDQMVFYVIGEDVKTLRHQTDIIVTEKTVHSCVRLMTKRRTRGKLRVPSFILSFPPTLVPSLPLSTSVCHVLFFFPEFAQPLAYH